MKIILRYITIMILLLGLKVQAQSELNNYLKIGAENNPSLKAKFADYNAVLQKIPQVSTLPDPTLSFAYFVTPIETRVGPQKARVGIAQMFPWFGTLGAKKDVTIELAKAKYEGFEEAKSKLFFNIKSTYYNVYYICKAIQITEQNIAILNTFQQLSLIKIETGKSSIVDEMRVEMEINELKNQLAYLKDSKRAMEVEFNKILNVPSNNSVLIPTQLWSDNLEMSKSALLDSITHQNHIVKQLEHKLMAWQKQETVASKMGKPQISLGLDYVFIGKSSNPALGSENGQDAIILPKIGITVPIYRKKYNAMVNEVVFNMEAAEFRKTAKQNNLIELFEKSYSNYSDAKRRIVLYKRQLRLAEKSLNVLLTSYSSNGENFEEVLRMERKVLQYALELDKARTDINVEVAFINYLLGKS